MVHRTDTQNAQCWSQAVESGPGDDRQECIAYIARQVEAFEGFLNSSEVSDAAFLGADTSVGNWKNISLDAFLDAASDGTDFKKGVYEQTWDFVRNFYELGQTLE
eukprot:gnl/TRDRNA2_/TRDRNA2_85608_c0_seq1.p2 gnl/TRDRNA2_/TRDRNA2_85608_c0~~gnl/TRDRNA2_/TRDRNA2_85608_c0_seq1.p2  ORF type:complete len:105 (-),score=21.46 gnl/TRDRNA2_/TRDRNA2_85608_c0_seq1:137-451(-)